MIFNTQKKESLDALLSRLFSLCVWRGLSFSIHMQESDRQWYIALDSPAPDECRVGKDHGSLKAALKETIEYLNK